MFNDPIEIILIAITGIAAVIFLGRGWIRIINTAYSESTLQGLLCLFPLYAIYYAIKKQHSELKSVITELMRTVAARNVEAAYACWSRQSATKEDIAELIKSKRDVFVGYERLSINSLGTRSVEGITESDVGGAIIYIDGKRLPFKARLVKEDDVWKITNINIDSTAGKTTGSTTGSIISSTAEWWRDKKKLAIIGSIVVVILLLGVMLPHLMQFFSGVNTVIAEFMEAGAARNMKAAYACWSPQSASEEEIAEFIESNYGVFTGYERVDINSQSGQSSGSIDSCYAKGAVVYTGGQRLPLEARLVKESDAWKITGIQVGSTALFCT